MKKIFIALLLIITGLCGLSQGTSHNPNVRLRVGITGMMGTAHSDGWYYDYYYGDPPNYIPRATRERWYAIMLDSTFHPPRYNGVPTGSRVGAATQDGAMGIDTLNGRVYFKINGNWLGVANQTDIVGSTNSNIGAGFRWAVPNTNNIKTFFAGYAFSLDSISNANAITAIVDSVILSQTYLRRKDSATGTNLNGYLTRSSLPTYQTNIYNSDGTVTADRTVDVNSHAFEIGNFQSYNLWAIKNPFSTKQTDSYWTMDGDIITATLRNIARTKSTELTADSSWGMNSFMKGQGGVTGATLRVGEKGMLFDLANPWYINGLTSTSDTTLWKPLAWNPTDSTVKKMSFWPGSGGAASSVPINGITAATATNAINHLNFEQDWNWSTLASGAGLALTTTSTAAASNFQRVLYVSASGTNVNSSQTTIGGYFTNQHNGTNATNIGLFAEAVNGTNAIGLKASAISGTNNYAIIVPSGNGSVGIGTSTPTSLLHVVSAQTTGIGSEFISSTTTSGIILDITGTSTALAANNKGLNIAISGANGTNAITATGAKISVTNTNGTSGTNVGLDITASGATTQNTAINVTAGDVALNNNLLYGNSNAYNNQTGTTYTLLSSDNGKIVTLSNASAITLTVPASLPAGFNCTVTQLGTGQVTITGSGTTIHNGHSFTKIKGQYSSATILQYSANNFATQGDME